MTGADRIKQAMNDAGIETAAELARRSGLNEVTVRAYVNSLRELTKLAPAIKLGRALSVSPQWLLGASNDKKKSAGGAIAPLITEAPVRGVVQAGTWKEYEDCDFSELPPVPAIPGRWAGLEQFAFKVAGTSVNKLRIFDGDYVICVPYWAARTGPLENDVVAVEQRRGPQVMRTVKRLRIVKGGYQLFPESDDPRHQEPLFVKKAQGFSDGEGTEIEIVGLVIGRYAPM